MLLTMFLNVGTVILYRQEADVIIVQLVDGMFALNVVLAIIMVVIILHLNKIGQIAIFGMSYWSLDYWQLFGWLPQT